MRDELRPGTGYVVYDEVTGSGIDQSMLGTMFGLFEQSEEELLITNAYIVPGKPGIEMLRELDDRGVDVRILTNSLASHDVPAVNSHYAPWRKRLLRSGVELFEFRSDPAIKSIIDAPAVDSKFSGLHTKAAVVDRKRVFIGSMNLDPRSAAINTEMGAVIDSVGLAEEVRRVMLRDMAGGNAWKVTLDENDRLEWTNSERTVRSQPSRGFLQRVMDLILKLSPRDQV